MNKPALILSVSTVALAAAVCVTADRNKTLRRSLDDANRVIETLRAAAAAPVANMPETKYVEVKVPVRAEVPEPAAEQAVRPGADMVPQDVLDQAVEQRLEERRKEREAQREARRREWENQTPEEREARHQEFLGRMRERADARYNEFVERVGLDERQSAAFGKSVETLDTSVRKLVEDWSEAIRENGTFSQSDRLVLMQDVMGLMLNTYDEMDATLPASWREADGDINLMQLVGGDAFEPLMAATREAGVNGGGMLMGLLMGGGRPPWNRGGNNARGGNGGNNGGGFAPPPPPPGM